MQWFDRPRPRHHAAAEPGRVQHTFRDLIGIDFHPADDFPADDVGYGFDNVGDVLSTSPLLIEKYLAAAERIVDKAAFPQRSGGES